MQVYTVYYSTVQAPTHKGEVGGYKSVNTSDLFIILSNLTACTDYYIALQVVEPVRSPITPVTQQMTPEGQPFNQSSLAINSGRFSRKTDTV